VNKIKLLWGVSILNTECIILHVILLLLTNAIQCQRGILKWELYGKHCTLVHSDGHYEAVKMHKLNENAVNFCACNQPIFTSLPLHKFFDSLFSRKFAYSLHFPFSMTWMTMLDKNLVRTGPCRRSGDLIIWELVTQG